ncbi:MAG TPA: hypothetical protein VGQ76_20535 [Thermoanaerobaculia bacterium]|jgi:methylphosphotriester-DNA--protein-cysteine methyltransferase|nr:hypothetical protein [Thermoanaerobaculia bacterium]
MNSRTRLLAVVLLFVATLLSAEAAYRGNTRSRVFHQSSCRYFHCKNCTATFGSAAEAVREGYRACGECRPGERSNVKESESSYAGNTSTHKFHRSSCRYASCRNCTAKFASREDAIDAGYVPGGCCKP